MKKYIYIFVLAIMFSCNNDDDNEIICATIFVYGLNIVVNDAQTNTAISEGIMVKAIDGTYVEELMNLPGSDAFVGAGERPGNYIIEISSDNYEDFTSGIIVVDEDECHVIPRILEFSIQPN